MLEERCARIHRIVKIIQHGCLRFFQQPMKEIMSI